MATAGPAERAQSVRGMGARKALASEKHAVDPDGIAASIEEVGVRAGGRRTQAGLPLLDVS